MDIISRLPGCAGQAADAVSAYTQVKREDDPKLQKIPKSECPDLWIRLPLHKWPKSWSSMEDPVVPLERNLYGHPFAGMLWEMQFEKILLQHVGRRFLIGNAYSYTLKKDYSYLCMWMPSNCLERNKTLFRCGKYSIKKLIWENKHLSFDHVYLGCTQRQCEISKEIVDNYRTMFESRISAGRTEKLPYSQNLRISSWSCDMEGHAKKCVERYCELANNTTQQLYKVSTPCIDDHHFKEEEMKSVGELSQVCSQFFL